MSFPKESAMADIKLLRPTNLSAVFMGFADPTPNPKSPQYDSIVNLVKILIEKYPVRIEGLNDNWAVETVRVGYDDLKEAKVYKPLFPKFYFEEREGLIIQQSAEVLIDYKLSVMFFETDELKKTVRRAWLCDNMTLKSFDSASAVMVGDNFSLSPDERTLYTSMTFGCQVARGDTIVALAQTMRDSMNLSNVTTWDQVEFIK